MPKELEKFNPKLKLTTVKYYEHNTEKYVEPKFEPVPYVKNLPEYKEKLYKVDHEENIPFREPQEQTEGPNAPYKHEFPKYTTEYYAEPKYEEPKYEEPKYEEPKSEEPKYEEPKYEEPKYEEPKSEEHKYL